MLRNSYVSRQKSIELQRIGSDDELKSCTSCRGFL